MHASDYWRTASYPGDWNIRAKIAARYIASGANVLDLGCGAPMYLRAHLPPGCSYTPSDVTQWTPQTVRCDLNAGEFPPGAYDCVAMLGLIEYLRDPVAVLKRARTTCESMVLTYYHRETDWRFWRRPRGHAAQRANNLTENELASLIRSAGWRIESSAQIGERQTIYHCRHA